MWKKSKLWTCLFDTSSQVFNTHQGLWYLACLKMVRKLDLYSFDKHILVKCITWNETNNTVLLERKTSWINWPKLILNNLFPLKFKIWVLLFYSSYQNITPREFWTLAPQASRGLSDVFMFREIYITMCDANIIIILSYF